MGKKGVDASFIKHCKERKLSAKRVAVTMRKKGYSEDDIVAVYKELYEGEPIFGVERKRVAHRAVMEHLNARGENTHKMMDVIKTNQYILTLLAFMLLGFLFSTLYILTAFMGYIFATLLMFGSAYFCGILLYNVFRMLGVGFSRQLWAAILAPFAGLSFIAASGFFFAAIRSLLVDLFMIHGPSIASPNLVITVLQPLNPVFAMFLFFVGFNLHSLIRLSEHVPQRDFIAYVFSIPTFLFALVMGWLIFQLFLKDLVLQNIFGG